VSTLADDYSSTLSVSDKARPSGEAAAADHKASSSDSSQPGSWSRPEDETAGKQLTPNRPLHLVSDVDSEGILLLLF